MGLTIDCWKDSITFYLMQHNNRNKKPSEWVGAPVVQPLCERKKGRTNETITPSDRVLRPRPGSKQLEGQATDVKLVTELPIGPVMNMDLLEAKKSRKQNPQTQSSRKTSCKLSSSTQPESHHRVVDQLPLSPDGGLSNETLYTDYAHAIHPQRVSNSSNIERKLEIRINFPSSNDKIWSKVDEDLKVAIPKVFTKQVINMLSTSNLSKKFDAWLHQFFLERFGPKEVKERITRQKRPNKAMVHLRKRKKQCKAARKALIKAGLKGTPEEEIITKEWLSLVRQHNKLRISLNKKQSIKDKLQAEKSFRSNPHKFAQNLFSKEQNSGKPTFSAETAQQYFQETYRDEERDYVYEPLPEFQRPQLPTYMFSLRCPTEQELMKSARKKRNGAAPGMNALSYVPYKKCSSIIKFLAKLGRKIWKSRDIPVDWAMAYIILLPKSENLTLVSEFRPIAIACCAGKIFFSVVSDRLQVFILRNNYISKEVQKGFLAGMPGCIEHTFALLEALRDAKESHRQIVITWLDLANAYGSVRHNLIQFALNWYHVPKPIQELIFDYYEKLCAFISTANWSTGFFLFDIGLFQGCVLSTIMFDCVFQLLLDFLHPKKALGYNFKSSPSVSTHKKAYADDLTLITRNTLDMQLSVDHTDSWLKWTQTMKSKPTKCISLGFKLFDKRIKSEQFVPLFDTIYSPFDPKITIDEKPMKFICNPLESDPFKANHFKFLGRWLNPLINEKQIKQKISESLSKDIEKIHSSKVNGFMKLWLYQFYALSHLSWPFIINDLDKSFALELQRNVNVMLKQWAGIGRTVENGVLFRSKKNFGLGLTPISDHYQRLQVVKCELLRNSKDSTIRELYTARQTKNAKLTKVWKASKIATIANTEVELNLKFPCQDNRQGIGFGNFDPHPPPDQKRNLVAAKAISFLEDARVVHSLLTVWLQWAEITAPFDFTWKNIIWGGISPEVVKFILNASVNWVRTPVLMKLWGYKQECSCCLCGAEKCTLHHILSECKFALCNQRFTWRHDSVLSAIKVALEKHVLVSNTHPIIKHSAHIAFVKAGDKSQRGHANKKSTSSSLLNKSNDWKLLFDLPGENYVFPPEIYSTAERPDILIWSPRLKQLIMIELTCPAEEGMEAAKVRKQSKYMPLIDQINRNTPWKTSLLTLEVGVRGFVAHSSRLVFIRLGISSRQTTELCNQIGTIAAKCSYAIYLASNATQWDQNRALIS